jgi:hypothetical protein
VEEGGCSLIEVTSRHFPGETEEYHERSQSGYPVSRARFKLSTTRIQVKNVSATPACFLYQWRIMWGCYTKQSNTYVPKFRRNLLLPSSDLFYPENTDTFFSIFRHNYYRQCHHKNKRGELRYSSTYTLAPSR